MIEEIWVYRVMPLFIIAGATLLFAVIGYYAFMKQGQEQASCEARHLNVSTFRGGLVCTDVEGRMYKP